MDPLQYSIPHSEIEHIGQKTASGIKRSMIYIMHADKIPPHIGWAVDDLFYSLKANGVDYDFPRMKLDTLLCSKAIPTLLVALKEHYSIDKTRQAFRQFGQSIDEGNTCLSPIDHVIHGPFNNATRIGDLLHQLEQEEQIEQFYGFHIPETYRGICDYSAAEINARIEKLKRHD